MRYISHLKKYVSYLGQRISKMTPHVIESIWYLLVLILVLSATYLGILVYRAYYQYNITMVHPPYSDDPGMNQLEVVYFLGNTIVALIAAFSILFARWQIKHAEKSRRASIYMELHKRYNEQPIRYSYRKITSFIISYDTQKVGNETIGQYTHRVMLEYYHDHVNKANSLSGDETEYSKTIAILPFFEDIGVLVAKGYLQSDDLFNYIGSIIVKSEEILRDHIKWIRENRGNDPRVYANALILMKQATVARPHIRSFNEGDYRIIN
jgi:hypothetical protein